MDLKWWEILLIVLGGVIFLGIIIYIFIRRRSSQGKVQKVSRREMLERQTDICVSEAGWFYGKGQIKLAVNTLKRGGLVKNGKINIPAAKKSLFKEYNTKGENGETYEPPPP